MSEERDLRPEIERIKERKDGLDVIDDLVHAARHGGFAALAPDDLALAKWWGIYPQRPEEDGYLMLRVRVSNGQLDGFAHVDRRAHLHLPDDLATLAIDPEHAALECRDQQRRGLVGLTVHPTS